MDINETAQEVHRIAVEHGFWDKERNYGEMLMLVTSELAEALEEDRQRLPRVYWKCPVCEYKDMDVTYVAHARPDNGDTCENLRLKPEGSLVEVADAIIRLFDLGHHEASMTPYSLNWVITHKMDYNESREHMHGRAY